MPIYEYKCRDCGKAFEFIMKFSDEPLKECPDCKGELVKLISNTSFVLKGAGWYADGYSSAKNSTGTSGSGGSAGEGKGSAPSPAAAANIKPSDTSSRPVPAPASKPESSKPESSKKD